MITVSQWVKTGCHRQPWAMKYIYHNMENQASQTLYAEMSERYDFDRSSPMIDAGKYRVYEATQRDINVEVTLKLLLEAPEEVTLYLRKMRNAKVENVIKFYEVFDCEEGMFVAMERASYPTLSKALANCRKLDDFDGHFLAKAMLAAQVDMLRAGLEWRGSEEDVEFTQGGLRFSWNNSGPVYGDNPFPLMVSRLAGKFETNEQKILPFPKSKGIQELIKISSSNASEISLNKFMKKKEKFSKRRSQEWMGLKEYKNDFEYYQELLIFAIHRVHGFVRVKVFPVGAIDKNILALNQHKSTFTRVHECYEEGGKSVMVSAYSNDGSLYNYVNKLKANAIALKEEHIEFFFYSLFEPLKLIQDSPIESLSMLHIRNIYIENGIPKIGEPVPLNREMVKELKEKSEVPDFYHTAFKKNPKGKGNYFDTYSLGVLMYKLMYTEYPIFPNKQVHIPSAPSYNPRLKATLQILLDQGGRLKDLEQKIEVSQEVAKQVKLNKNKLLKEKEDNLQRSRMGDEEELELIDYPKKDADTQENLVQVGEEEQVQDEECCKLCCAQLQDPVKHRSVMLDTLEESPYSSYRICAKVILVLCLYIFLFYFWYIESTFELLSAQTHYQRMNVTISTVNYEITVSSSNDFYTSFNVTDRSLAALQNMGCFINNLNGGPDFTGMAKGTDYEVYVLSGIVVLLVIVVFKVVQLVKFDFIFTLYNMSNLRSNFNLSNYLIWHLLLAGYLHNHFTFYHQVFENTAPACLGTNPDYDFSSTHYFYHSPSDFQLVFVTTLMLHSLILLLHLIMLVRTLRIRYTRLFNPILLIAPFFLGYFLVARLGVVSEYFYPSILKDIGTLGKFFTSINFVAIIGMVPEILFLLQFLIEWVVDSIFWFCFDKKRRMLIHDMSTAGIVV